MALSFLTHIFGSRNERLLKQYRKIVAQINALEPSLEKLSDDALRGKTDEFKSRVAHGETLDALLPEAYAVVREASKRVMKCATLMCRCLVVFLCITEKFLKCAQVRVRHSLRLCLCI